MNYAEIISGDGEKVYRERIALDTTVPFGDRLSPDHLIKWVRLEAWDVATNGAFTQTVWIK